MTMIGGTGGRTAYPRTESPQRTIEMAVVARQSIPVSVSVRSVEEVRDALKKGARLARVGTLETVLYQVFDADRGVGGGKSCKVVASQYGNYESALGTGQVMLWSPL
jgi:hypothetical protein